MTQPDDAVTLILVDDHAMVREGLRAFLATQPDLHVVGEAARVDEAIDLARERRPDVAVVDLVLEDGSGVEATRGILRVSPDTNVLVLTSFDDDASLFPALRAGAVSYMLKDLDAPSLADAVRSTALGEAALHPRLAGRLMRHASGTSQDPAGLDLLTARETEVLRLVAEGHANRRIASALHLSEATVKGHVSSILSKLCLDDRTQAAALAWRTGLVER